MNNIEKSKRELIMKFIKIKNMGYVKSVCKGNAGVGITFEKLIGKSADSLENPDYKGIEIKSKKGYSNSKITLFNYAPIGCNSFETNRIRNLYGYQDRIAKNFKVLNNDVYANKLNFIGTKYQFKLKIDRSEQKIFLLVFNVFGSLIEKSTYWSFKDLESKLINKASFIAYIKANRKYINKIECFKYTNIEFYKIKGFDVFLDLIESGKINICFKIGVFRYGDRVGQTHDHGTGFKISENDLRLLYDVESL